MNDRRLFSRTNTVIVASAALIGAFGFWVVRPMLIRNKDSMNAIQAMQVDQDIVQNQQRQLQSIRSQAEYIRGVSDQLTVTVSPDDPIRWVQDFEQLAKDTGNTITIETNDALSKKSPEQEKKPTPAPQNVSKTTPNKAVKPPTLQEELVAAPALGLRLTLNGDYASLTLFLKKLELLPYYVDALSIAFSKNDNGEVKPASVRAGNTPSASRDLFQLPTNTPNASTPQGDQNHPVDFRPLRLILNVAIAVSK